MWRGGSRPAKPAIMQWRLLIVDDEEPILFALSDFFSTLGFEVDCARELGQAKRFIDQNGYVVVIADLRLTGVYDAEGLQLVSYIRERAPQTKVVLLTAYGFPDIEREARRRGVCAFLHKPKPLAEIVDLVTSMIDERPTSEPMGATDR
jgi:DNA-binding NtrC family response regulator